MFLFNNKFSDLFMKIYKIFISRILIPHSEYISFLPSPNLHEKIMHTFFSSNVVYTLICMPCKVYIFIVIFLSCLLSYRLSHWKKGFHEIKMSNVDALDIILSFLISLINIYPSIRWTNILNYICKYLPLSMYLFIYLHIHISNCGQIHNSF